MDNTKTFPLSLEFEGKRYKGVITPSEERGKNGMPVYFRVTVGGALFAYLCCGDNGWQDRDSDMQQDGLVHAIGRYIVENYA